MSPHLLYVPLTTFRKDCHILTTKLAENIAQWSMQQIALRLKDHQQKKNGTVRKEAHDFKGSFDNATPLIEKAFVAYKQEKTTESA